LFTRLEKTCVRRTRSAFTQVVLLDLKASKYLGIGGRLLPALAQTIDGWPGDPRADPVAAAPAEVEPTTQRLLSQGLLTYEPAPLANTVPIEEPTASFDADVPSGGATLASGESAALPGVRRSLPSGCDSDRFFASPKGW
jgi:hypothetical protein